MSDGPDNALRRKRMAQRIINDAIGADDYDLVCACCWILAVWANGNEAMLKLVATLVSECAQAIAAGDYEEGEGGLDLSSLSPLLVSSKGDA